jgi:hypothetical protein
LPRQQNTPNFSIFNKNKNQHKMENNSESIKGAFETKLRALKARHGQATKSAGESWYTLLGLTEIPPVQSLDGKSVLPMTVVLKQINQLNEKFSGLFEALALIDPVAMGDESEQDKLDLIDELEGIFKSVEERLDEIKKLLEPLEQK